MLITDREDWPDAEVVAGYRSQSDAEFGFRQLKDPQVVSFSPIHHWSDHNIRVHVFTCVLALQIAHLMRRHARHAGMHLSVRELLDTLAGIEETETTAPPAETPHTIKKSRKLGLGVGRWHANAPDACVPATMNAWHR